MRMANRALSVLALVLGFASASHAQTFDDVRIDVWGESTKTVGGQQPSAGSWINPVVIGKTETWSFSLVPEHCGGFSVGPGNRPRSKPRSMDCRRDALRVTGQRSTDRHEPADPQVEEKAVTFADGLCHRTRARMRRCPPANSRSLCTRRIDGLRYVPCRRPASGPPADRNAPSWVCVRWGRRPESDRRLVTADLWLLSVSPTARSDNRQWSVVIRRADSFLNSIADGGVLLDVWRDRRQSPPGALK